MTACGERKTGNLQVVVDCVEGFHFQRIGVCIVSMILLGVAAVSKPDLNQQPSLRCEIQGEAQEKHECSRITETSICSFVAESVSSYELQRAE